LPSPTGRRSAGSQKRTNLPEFKEAHHRLINKSESYSKIGFGNGFASKADRFSDKNQLKYYYIPQSVNQTEKQQAVSNIKPTKIMKLRRPQGNLFDKKPDFIMRVAGEPIESVAAV